MNLLSRLSVLCLGISALAITGCGDATLSGTVKFSDGSPLTTGSVFFVSDTTQLSAGINSDGTYKATSDSGIPSGTYKVSLSGPIFGPDESTADTASDEEGEEGEEGEETPTYDEEMADDVGEALVARKFQSGDTSGLTYTGGAGTYDIVVEKP